MPNVGKLPRKPVTLAIVALAVVLVSIYAFRAWSRTGTVEQPIAFNHQVHIEGAQIECTDCHTHYQQGAKSGLPEADTCMFCHSEPVTESAEEARLRDLHERGLPVVFRKLFHLPPDIYYSHRRHVVLGKIECEKCHGDIANSSAPPSRPLVDVTMDFCMECHTQANVSNDCKSCHR